MKERRSYAFPLWINGRLLLEVVIDPHHEKKHPDISDALILEIVRGLDGREFQPDESADGWEFYLLDRLEHQGKRYRLVWCLSDQLPILGIINCFRRPQ